MSKKNACWTKTLCIKKKITENNLIKAICLTGVYFLAFLLIFQPFLGIDDVTYVERMYGIYGQGYSFYNAWVRWLYLAFVIKLIGLFPAIPWYTLIFHLLYFVAMSVVTYVILEWYHGRIGLVFSNIVLLFFSYEGFIAIIFTKMACIMGVAGLIVAIAPNVKKGARCVGVFLFFVATLIRIDAGPMALAFGAFIICAILLEFLSHGKKKEALKQIAISMVFLVISILAYRFSVNSNNLLFSHANDYTEYVEFYKMNSLRSGIQDFQIPKTDEMTEFYEKEGISDNDLYIWHNWNYDWNLISPEVSQKLISSQERTGTIWEKAFEVDNIIDFFKIFPLNLLSVDVFIGVLIIFFIIYMEADCAIKALRREMVVFLYMLSLNYYLFINGRYLQHRVDVGIALGTILLVLVLVRQFKFEIKKKCVVPMVILIALCGNYMQFQDDLPPVSETRMKNNKEFFQRTQDDMEHCYVVCNDSGGRYFLTSVEAYDVLKPGSQRNIIAINYYEPMVRDNLKNYDLTDPYIDCLNRNDIYLMFRNDNDDQDKWEDYITQHTGEDTKLELVKNYYDVKIYKAHSKKIDQILDFTKCKEGNVVVEECNAKSASDKIIVTGNAHLNDSQGYNENIYLEIHNNETGESTYTYTTQTIDDTRKKSEDGFYSHFNTKLDIPEDVILGNTTIYVVVEDNEGNLYREKCAEL